MKRKRLSAAVLAVVVVAAGVAAAMVTYSRAEAGAETVGAAPPRAVTGVARVAGVSGGRALAARADGITCDYGVTAPQYNLNVLLSQYYGTARITIDWPDEYGSAPFQGEVTC